MAPMLVTFYYERYFYYSYMIMGTGIFFIYLERWLLVKCFIRFHEWFGTTEEMWIDLEQSFIHDFFIEWENIYVTSAFYKNSYESFCILFFQPEFMRNLFFFKSANLSKIKIGYCNFLLKHKC